MRYVPNNILGYQDPYTVQKNVITKIWYPTKSVKVMGINEEAIIPENRLGNDSNTGHNTHQTQFQRPDSTSPQLDNLFWLSCLREINVYPIPPAFTLHGSCDQNGSIGKSSCLQPVSSRTVAAFGRWPFAGSRSQRASRRWGNVGFQFSRGLGLWRICSTWRVRVHGSPIRRPG